MLNSSREGAGGMGAGAGRGGSAVQKALINNINEELGSAVHGVRLDLEETGQPREDQITFTLS